MSILYAWYISNKDNSEISYHMEDEECDEWLLYVAGAAENSYIIQEQPNDKFYGGPNYIHYKSIKTATIFDTPEEAFQHIIELKLIKDRFTKDDISDGDEDD